VREGDDAGIVTQVDEPSLDLTGTQITVSEGHQWPPDKNSGLTDVGGSFYTTKTYVEGEIPQVGFHRDRGNFRYKYNGPLFPAPTNFGSSNNPIYFPPDLSSSDSQLEDIGTTAIARCKPTNSVADVSTFLGELLREGLPALVGAATWRDRTDNIRKNAGGEYLNVQFGWQPLVSEINSIAKAITHTDSVLAQVERDAGRVVRRQYNVPMTREADLVGSPQPGAALFAAQYGAFLPDSYSPESIVLVKSTTRERRFSGAFTYHMPTGYYSRSALAGLASRAEILLGVSPTPETLWNLGPWSWAVDWVSNTGDVISNITDAATYGLVLVYGYMMEHTISKYTYTLSGSGLRSELPQSSSQLVLVRETKKRVKASPFGFGVTLEGLNPYQLSIISALGISRG
jgi:hypothetical protein